MLGSSFVDKLVSPDRPRGIAARYGSGLILPLASLALMHALFPIDKSPFVPLLVLSIVCAALFGGIQSGIVATAVSVLAAIVAAGPGLSLRIGGPEGLFHVVIFTIVGVFISIVAGSVGALNRKVEAERQRLHVTLSCIGDAVISTDLDGQVVFMNPAAEKATGWSSAEASGKPPEKMFRIVNQKTRTVVENPIRMVLETDAVAALAGHTLLVRRDGSEIPINDSAAPIRDAQGKMIGAVMVFRDIAGEAEREAAWLQTQRLASVGRLAATIAHEINNPLQATSNFLFLISRGEDLKKAQGYATAAAQELLRASEIAKQTLTFVRGAGERESVPVSQLFDDVMSLYRNKLNNKNIEVVTDYSSHTFIDARKGEIRQVLGNLIGNALDALPRNGRLYFRAKPSNHAGRTMVKFVVADTGSGITKEHLARIFEPFFTTKTDVGTGLGLWVVKRIVDSEGGSLHFRSRFGRGTVARICWPAAPRKVISMPAIAASRPDRRYRPEAFFPEIEGVELPSALTKTTV